MQDTTVSWPMILTSGVSLMNHVLTPGNVCMTLDLWVSLNAAAVVVASLLPTSLSCSLRCNCAIKCQFRKPAKLHAMPQLLGTLKFDLLIQIDMVLALLSILNREVHQRNLGLGYTRDFKRTSHIGRISDINMGHCALVHTKWQYQWSRRPKETKGKK